GAVILDALTTGAGPVDVKVTIKNHGADIRPYHFRWQLIVLGKRLGTPKWHESLQSPWYGNRYTWPWGKDSLNVSRTFRVPAYPVDVQTYGDLRLYGVFGDICYVNLFFTQILRRWP